MKITEVRVKLLEGRSDRLRAFCSITIDGEFVVHDLRVIDGRKGLFVAMPSRKLSDSCPRCGGKNHLRAKHCSECAAKLDENRALKGAKARDKFHVDVAHPILPACRETVQSIVLQAYKDEVERVKQGLGPDRTYERDEDAGTVEAEEEVAAGYAAEAEEIYDAGPAEGVELEEEPEPRPRSDAGEKGRGKEEEKPRPQPRREGGGEFGRGKEEEKPRPQPRKEGGGEFGRGKEEEKPGPQPMKEGGGFGSGIL